MIVVDSLFTASIACLIWFFLKNINIEARDGGGSEEIVVVVESLFGHECESTKSCSQTMKRLHSQNRAPTAIKLTTSLCECWLKRTRYQFLSATSAQHSKFLTLIFFTNLSSTWCSPCHTTKKYLYNNKFSPCGFQVVQSLSYCPEFILGALDF